MWSKRLEDVNQQLRKSESEKKTLSDRLKAAEKDCSGVKARLQELEKALNDASSKELEEKLKVRVCPQYRWHITEILQLLVIHHVILVKYFHYKNMSSTNVEFYFCRHQKVPSPLWNPH